MVKFFICYSRSVKADVEQIVALLRASKHGVWWDVDIPAGADWWSTILDHIESCDVFIFVASQLSIKSPYCIAELKYANERRRPIFPFILESAALEALPDDLPSRNQWLIYDGNPAHMLKAINDACDQIAWEKYKDNPKAHRPPEPKTDGRSLAQLFQNARRLADTKQFDEAKKQFREIKNIDFDEWGSECDEWIERIDSYIPIMELVDESSTLHMAITKWGQHVRQYGKAFDPHQIEVKLKQIVARPKINLTILIPLSVIIIIVFAIVVSRLDPVIGGDPTPTEDLTLTNQANVFISETVNAQSTMSIQGTKERQATIDALSATPTPTATFTASTTPEPMLTATTEIRVPTATSLPNITGSAKYAGRPLRRGPYINDPILRATLLNEQYDLIARTETKDGRWFNVLLSNGQTAWLSEINITIYGDISAIPEVTPQPPIATSVAPQPTTASQSAATLINVTNPLIVDAIACEPSNSRVRQFIITNPNSSEIGVTWNSMGQSEFIFVPAYGTRQIGVAVPASILDSSNFTGDMVITWDGGRAQALSLACRV